jgi:endonuclease/exonuclease/phosphatase family metal-dependent hydrolase
VNAGRGPDILALQEVENRAVLERLRTQYLGPAGYRESILVEGGDPRGIDVAFLSRFPLHGEARLHRQAHVPDPHDVRGILEATFELGDGMLLTGFCAHFPAPMHPAAARMSAFAWLDALADALPPERLRFAAGDFNVNAAEERRYDLIHGRLAQRWIAAHVEGCGDCKGTYYYAHERAWSFLDMILVGRALDPRQPRKEWQLDPESVRIANDMISQSTAAGFPAGFELPAATGVSDHWPLIAAIVSE